MAQAGFTPILIYASGTATNVPAAGNLTSSASGAELAINYADGKLYYKDSGGNVQLIASKSGASGDVVGPASATDNAIVRFDGTTGKLVQNSVVTIADSTGDISGVGVLNATTLDATNIEVTNIKAKDGTAAASIADSTGKITVSTELAVDNLNLSGNTLSSTDTNGNIVLAPNGTGDVQLDADTVRIGDSNANATLTTNGTGDLILNTNSGTNSGSITIADGANGDMTLTPDGNGSVVITNNGTSNALRITQTGSGNALVVEDSANPDSTPFVVDASGIVITGNTAAVSAYGFNNQFQVLSTTNSYQLNAAFRNDAFSPFLTLAHSRNTSIGGHTVLQNGDDTGILAFAGSDGTQFIRTAHISSAVDGTPGTNDMPGRLVFSTTADGASSPTERMRIDSAGNVGIGITASSGTTLQVQKTLTGSVNSYNIYSAPTNASDVTNTEVAYLSVPSTGFAVSNVYGYWASQGTFTGAVTNQMGFHANSSLTGATNNFGFYSNIASGTNRWNFYANGTASNYFGGNTIISVADNTNAALRITQTGTGDALLVEDSANPDSSPFVVDTNGRVIAGYTASLAQQGVTAQIQNNGTSAGQGGGTVSNTYWQNNTTGPALFLNKSRSATPGSYTVVQSGDGLGIVAFGGDDGTAIIRGAAITAEVDGTPGTNDMPGRLVFSTTADGASSPTERMRIDNAGNVGIGAAVFAGVQNRFAQNITGATNAYPILADGTVQSDVTSGVGVFRSAVNTAAAAFTLTNLRHFWADQGTIGAGSAVTNQYGFAARSTLTGATNNYGFYSDIASGTNRWNFYANGTAANYFAGDMQLDKTVTATGTTGAQTINKNAGTVNFAAAATSLVVTDSRVTANSIIICTVGTNDTTMKSVAAVAGAGSFTLHANAAATAETRVDFLIIN